MVSNIIAILYVTYACIGCGMAGKLPGDVAVQSTTAYKYSMKDHNPVFDAYTKGFPSNIKRIPIVLVDKMKYAGLCHGWESGHREIEINKKLWNTYSDKQRHWLIWHELGHCGLNKKHVNIHINTDGEICTDDDEKYKCRDYISLSVMRWYVPKSDEIDDMCGRSETDKLSRLLCDKLGL